MDMWKHWSGTAKRLFLGFGSLVLAFGLASWWTLAGLGGMRSAMQRTMDDEASAMLALQLASAVRDQYAHQAHTIIIGDRSHLPLYTDAERRVLELTRQLRSHLGGGEEAGWMDDIERASAELDAIFRQRIVPAVVGGDRAFVQAEHARAQLVVSRIQDDTERLVDSLEGRISEERAHAAALERRSTRGIIALLLAVPLFAALVTMYVGRSIAGPVSRLRAGAERIAAGDLDTRIEVASRDEFGALARQFNAMAEAIKKHEAKLVQSEKLAGVGRLAAGVAHEINNPIGVILGYVKLLRKRGAGDADEDLAVIEEEALRCKEIVEGLLDLARPLQGGTDRVDLRDASLTVVARLQEARLLEGVEVSIEGSAVAEGHPLRLRQILTNLIRNAAEAAGPGGRVEVGLSGARGEALVEVHDSGPGLDAKALDRLFEPFFTTKDRGTGLGLAVSRAIARAHGGDVVAANAAGGGATFRVVLPGCGAPERAEGPPPSTSLRAAPPAV